MKAKLYLNAFLKFRNIAVLALALGFSALMNDPTGFPSLFQFAPINGIGNILYPASFVLYAALAMQTLSSKEFHEKFNRKQKIKTIQNLNYTSLRLASEAKRHTNNTYYQKLKKVMDDKNDIVNSFFRGEHSFLKERIVEQTLNLVISYTRLLTNFCIRSRELSNVDVSEIINRINVNTRKVGFAKDAYAAEEIKKVVEMDQKILDRLKEEKKDLERISTKLDYMESTVNMFKHQILSSVETEDMLEKLETAVNEATALDNVLEDRRRNKIRM
jgi:hypothetical protein